MTYARKINIMHEFYTIFARKKIVFARIGGQLPSLTARLLRPWFTTEISKNL